MRKLREDSTWSQLTPAQRETLEEWLFDENLGYAKTRARVQKVFGLETTVASVGRYYRRRARERQARELVEAQGAARALNALPVSVADLREAAVKLVGKTALTLAAERPEQVEALVAAARLLLESEDNEIRRARLRLAERQLDYEATAASQKELPHLRAHLADVGGNAALSEEEKHQRVHAILFGPFRPTAHGSGPDLSGKGK